MALSNTSKIDHQDALPRYAVLVEAAGDSAAWIELK